MNAQEVCKNAQEIDVTFNELMACKNPLSWLVYCINLEIDNAIDQFQGYTYTQNFMCNAKLIDQVTKLFRQKGFEFETLPIDNDYSMFDYEKEDDGKKYNVSFYISWEK